MTEQILNSAVMTLDSDFKIYRKHRNEAIAVISPQSFVTQKHSDRLENQSVIIRLIGSGYLL